MALFVKENAVVKYSKYLQFFSFNWKKIFGPCEKGYYFCLDKVDLHWVELKYVDSYEMQDDLEVDLYLNSR